MQERHLDPIYWPLRITYGAIPLLAGLDKFFGLLADWGSYLSPFVAQLLPVSPGVFLGLVGIIEMGVGLAILTRFTRLGAFVAAAWLALIAGNLVLLGILDVAVRDLAMAVGAYTLGRVAELRGDAWLPAASLPRHPEPAR